MNKVMLKTVHGTHLRGGGGVSFYGQNIICARIAGLQKEIICGIERFAFE
jgi:uncharacterized protein YsxB (DUF464 family)